LPAPAPAPANGGEDPLEKLRQLAELRDQGILTEEEFSAQKARLLA
jgi:Short C-terminal domain